MYGPAEKCEDETPRISYIKRSSARDITHEEGTEMNSPFYYNYPLRVLFVLASCVVSSHAVSFSGKLTDKTSGAPVSNAIVALRHTTYRTLSDKNGAFQLEVPDEVGVQRLPVYRTTAPIRIHTAGNRTVLDRGETPLRAVTVHRLDGSSVCRIVPGLKGQLLALPRMSAGLYLVTITTAAGVTVSHPYLHTAAPATCRFTVPAVAVSRSAQAATGGGILLTIRHDNYYPEDKVYQESREDLDIALEADPRAFVFNPAEIHTYSFTLTEADSILMEKNALAEEYTPAEFTFDDVSYGTVGLRYKGSDYYSMPRCFDEEGNRSDYPDCQNVSLKVKFNKFTDDTRFYQMKRLNLHSMGYDESKLIEMLAYRVFRDMGVVTCRTAFVKVFVNGVFRGLFTAVEAVDGRFTTARWPADGDGNLYKERWPVKINRTYYREGLKTNDNPEDSASVDRMRDFYRFLQTATPETFSDSIGMFIDMDYFLRYIAVDRAIHNSDGIMTWYKDGSWLANHNYFFYEEENEGGRHWLIPWDLNATFARTDEIIDEFGLPEWNVVPDSCGAVQIWGGSYAIPPNCDPLTGLTAATQWDKFVATGEQLLETVFTVEKLEEQVTTLAKLIQPVMQEYYPETVADWESSVNYLSESMLPLVSGFDDYIHGREPEIDTTGFFTPFPGDSALLATRINNFEFDPETAIESWITGTISDGSTFTMHIDTVAPLWGTADFRCGFSFMPADTTDDYSEWLILTFRFAQPVDLSACRQVRFNARSDLPRSCWFGLESDVYADSEVAELYGWQTGLRPTERQVTVDLETITYPSWAPGDNPDLLDAVLGAVTGVSFIVSGQFDNRGELLTVPDSGFVKIDNIGFDF